MNLDELQIKISIELDDLNKQLKTVTKGIDKALGPKATKKLMADNNKIVKSGLTSINKTTLNLVKKSRKDTTKEIEAMSKDITKTLNKAFDVSFTKLNSNITSAMNQAKMTVRSACNDIRRELNAALNINGNIRVTSKTSITGSVTGSSGSNAASSISSGQYIGAMIIKATNAVIANNNANTTRLEHAIDNLGNKLTSAIKGININTNNDDVVKAINNLGKKGSYRVKPRKPQQQEQEENPPAVIPQETKAKPKKKIQIGTKSNGIHTKYSKVDSGIFFTLEQLNHKVNFILGEVTDTGAFLKALQEALKQSVKATNRYNRFMDDIRKSINTKRLGTGSYGSNQLLGSPINFAQGGTSPLDTSQIEAMKKVHELMKQIRSLGRGIPSDTTSFTYGEVITPQKLGLPIEQLKKAKEIIEDVSYRVLDLETGLMNTSNFDLIGEGLIDESQVKALKQVHELMQKIKTTSIGLNAPDDSNSQTDLSQLNDIKAQLQKLSEEFEFDLAELFHDIDFKYLEESLLSVRDVIKSFMPRLKEVVETLNGLDAERIKLNIDTTDAQRQIEALKAAYEMLIEQCKAAYKANNASILIDIIPQIGGPVDSGNKIKYPPKPEGGFGSGSGSGNGTSNRGGKPPKPRIDRTSSSSSSEGDRTPRAKTPDPKDYSAFVSEVEKLSARLDIAADDLMNVIKLLDDASDIFNDLDNVDSEAFLKGFENLDSVEEILKKLSKTDLSHLNRDIKNLAQTISSDDEFETSAIKKLQDRLTALSQVRSKLSKIKTNADKGINTEALETQRRAVQNYKNASFGEASSGSLGFSAYRKELEQLSKLAKKVGAGIKKALKGAFNINVGPKKLDRALTVLEYSASSVANKIKTKMGSVGTYLKAIGKVMTEPMRKSIRKMGQEFNYVPRLAKLGMNRTSALVKSYSSVIGNHLNKAFTGIKSSKLYTSVSTGLNKAKGAVSKFSSKVKPILNKAFTGIKVGSKVASNIGKGLNKAKGVLNKFANKCKTIWGKIKQIFSKGANDASRATGKLTSGLKGLLAQAFGFFSIYSLINLGREAITQSQTLAQAEIKLTSLMKQRMGATNDTVTAIRQLVEEQSKLGVVSKTALTRGAEQLSMYVHSAKALKELMPAIANLTAKRGGFMATEDDAEEIATQLGEAIREGTTTPLEQSGIYLSEAEIKKFAALRTEEERAAYLANVIAKNVGNINQALANTPIGAMTQLKNNFKELLGTLGIFLANVLKPIVQWLNVIVVACNNALKALGKLLGFDMTGGALSVGDIGAGGSTEVDTGGIDDAKDSLDDTADSAEDAEKAVEKFKGSLMGFDEINVLSDNTGSGSDPSDEYDPTDITPGAGGQLIPDVGELTEGEGPFDKFADKMKAFMDEVLEPFKNAWALLGDRWKAEWADLIDSFKHFCDSLATFLKSVWEHGGKEFVQHIAEIGLACGIAAMEIGGEILDSLARLWDHLDPSKNMNTQGFLDALNETSVKIRDFVLGLGDHFESLMANGGQDVLNSMGDCFMNLGEAATRGFGVAIDALDGFIDHLDPANNENTKNMLQSLADMFHATGQTALDFVSLLESCLVNGGQDMINAFGDMMMNLGQATSEVITTMMQSFSELFKYLDPATNEITRGMMKSWEEAFGSIGQGLLDFSGFFKSVMENGGQEVLNAFADMLNSLVGLVGDIVDEMAKAASELYKHLDPSKNEYTKGMLTAWKGAFESITDMFGEFGELISSTMENGGQEIVNSIGDLGANIVGAIGEVVDEVAKAFAELFDHMDPEKNENSKNMLESFDKLVDSLNDFVDAIAKAFKKFMDSGGREFVKNLGDILAIVADLAFTLGGGIIDLITGFINSFVGQKLIEGVAKALEWFSDKLLGLKDAVQIIKDAFQDVIDIIVGIFEGDGEKVGRAFASLIKNALKLTGELVEWLVQLGMDLVAGLVKGICSLPKLLWEAVKFLFDTIVGFFKELFGIHSPSTVFADLGVNLIEGLIEGIKGMLGAIGDTFTNLKDSIVGWVQDIVGGAVEKWGELKEGIATNLGTLYDTVSEKWEDIYEDVSGRCKDVYDDASKKWEEVKKDVTGYCKDIYEDVKDKWDKVKENVTENCKNVYNDAKDKWDRTKENVTKNCKEIHNDAIDKWNKVKENVTKNCENIYTNAESNWKSTKDKTLEYVGNIKSGAEEAYDGLKIRLGIILDNVNTEANTKWETIKTTTSGLIDNIRTEAEELYDKLKTNLGKILDNVNTEAGIKWDAIKSTTNTWVGKVVTEATNVFGKIKDGFFNKIDEVKNTWGPKWEGVKSSAGTKAKEAVDEATNRFGEMKSNFTSKIDEAKRALEPKWDDLKANAKAGASKMLSGISEGLTNIGTAITKPFNSAKKAVGDVIREIGNTFRNANWSFPKIKLPHIKITGSWSFNPPKVPSFDINWYKRGGIIDGITPLGFANGSLHMGGEAGKELVMPLENTSFTSKIAQAIGQAVDNTLARQSNPYNNAYNVIDDKRDIVLKINDREFARCAINSINKLQRESGRTLLDI